MSVNYSNALVPVRQSFIASKLGIKNIFRFEIPKQYVEKQLKYVDRSGQALDVQHRQTWLFRFFYDCSAGNLVMHGITFPIVSKLVGFFLDSSASKPLIPSFIRRNDIDVSEYEAGPYKNFNSFFCRKILDGKRTIDTCPNSIISPCDGKIQVFPINEDSSFEIKGISYTIEKLLKSEDLAKRFNGGTLMLLRLGVDDYHHYIYPVDGNQFGYNRIGGKLHTVNPYVASRRPIYSENSREYCVIETEDIGKVIMMEVGALMVGRIVNRHPIGKVSRGEKKGYFKFGASSIVLCFEKGAVIPDAELIRNTLFGAETIVKLGERIALKANTKEQ